jgi:putative colanic acid biosynthesis acetyltransferase WcaF
MQNLDKFILPKGFRGRSAISVQFWWLIERTFFALSPQFLYGWRRWLLRLFGARIGKNVKIRPSVKTTYPWKVSIGDHSWIGDNVVLYSLGEIEIGANTVISQKSYLCTASHDFLLPSFDIFTKKIQIASEVWIASDVFIAPGVVIEKGSVVGARSTVLDNLPANMICFGNPAKPIRLRLL